MNDTPLSIAARRRVVRTVSFGVFGLFLFITLCLVGCPAYNVYHKRMKGKAALAEAESNRKIAVAEAEAKAEAAVLLYRADTIRAQGVARSNEIIGESLRGNEAYLHWLWIDNIEKNPQAVIYVPTEANLPILESTRLLTQKQNNEKSDTADN